MYKRLLTLLALIFCGVFSGYGKQSAIHKRDFIAEFSTNPALSGINHCEYPYWAVEDVAPIPSGYEPFFAIYHARHGSRYDTGSQQYKTLIDILSKAADEDALTQNGIRVLKAAEKFYDAISGREGDLTPKGVKQHKDIAYRMYRNYPGLFADSTLVDAKSTQVFRTIHSMDAFCEGLKENNPSLRITHLSSPSYRGLTRYDAPRAKKFLDNHEAPYYKAYKEYKNEQHVSSKRFVSSLFKNPDYVKANEINRTKLFSACYSLAEYLQNTFIEENLYDLFTVEEVYKKWSVRNVKSSNNYGGNPNTRDSVAFMGAGILRYMVDYAEEAIGSESPTVKVRISHDSQIGPLACLLRCKRAVTDRTDPRGISETVNMGEVVPMATNLQLVLFRKPNGGDIIATVRLNERDACLPVKTVYGGRYYKWSDLKAYFNTLAR